MSNAFPLSPVDENWLSSRLVYQQLTQNEQSVTLAANTTAATPVSLLTDGSGRGYMNGSVNVTNGSPVAGQALFTLPQNIVPLTTSLIPVAVLRSGAYVANAVEISAAGSAISGVTISNGGNYVTEPTVSISGPGNGAVLVNHMAINSQLIASHGTGYVPGDTITLAGGTSSTTGVLTLATTQVVSATIAAAGTGGTDGTQTVTGTTGTGTHFQASVTVAGGGITAVLSILVAGNYTVNPTVLATEPVTGAGLTGAQLDVVMGAALLSSNVDGNYTVLPANPVAQASTSGPGTGATVTLNWRELAIVVSAGGTGYTSASSIAFSGGGQTVPAVATIQLGASTTGIVSLVNAATQNDIVNLNGINFFTQSYS